MKIAIDRKILYLVIFTLGWLAIGGAILLKGWSTTWTALHIPVLSPSIPFEDMRTVQGSLRSVESGLNPQVQNPGDPWYRAMNYPIIWYWIARLFQFDHEINLMLFVSAYILAYIAACFLLMRKSPSVFLLLALFSWPSLLAVERGNNDLLAFALIFAGITLSQGYLRAFSVLLTTILKVYPALLVVTFAKRPKILTFLILIIAGFFIFNFGELKIIQAGNSALNDPASLYASYGLETVVQNIENVVTGQSIISHVFLTFVLYIFSFLSIVILSWSKYLKLANVTPYKTDLFISGGIIFSGTFLITSNWDYRLVFLLFCIPYISSIQNRFVKYSMLMGILLSSNFGFLWANPPILGSLLSAMIKYYVFLMVSARLLAELMNYVPVAIMDRLQQIKILVILLNRLKQVSATVLEGVDGESTPLILRPRSWLLFILILAGLVYFNHTAQKYFLPRIIPHYGRLTLHITGLRPPGNMIIHLQSVGDTNFSRTIHIGFDTAEMTYDVDGLYFGDYVIRVVHDENNNEIADVDSETGQVREGFGMANMDKLNLRGAASVKEGDTFDNLKYTFGKSGEAVEIKMHYPPFPWQSQ